mmetsp:Transcript_7382/g.17571  ORF Transcript_7382/g.17571 Transcript_7382/m.17571 type:complete len:236 (+) Transcript_7382:813-1520(+)
MKTTLVSKGRGTYKWSRRDRRAIESFIDESRHRRHVGQVVQAGHLATNMQSKRGYDGAKIGVARPFPDAIDGALNETSPGPGGRYGIGHRHSTIVVRVHANRNVGKLLNDDASHLLDLPGHASSVGITKYQTLGPRRRGSLATLQGIRGVVLVPIIKVLEIDKGPDSQRGEVRDGVGDHVQILLRSCPNDVGDLPQMTLGHDAHGRGSAIHQSLNLRVVLGLDALPPSGPKGHQT